MFKTKNLLIAAVLFSFVFVMRANVTFCQTPAQTQQDVQAEADAEADKALTEDLGKKIDTTIKVLDVLKGELKDYQAEQATLEKDAATETAGTSWGKKVGSWIGRLTRAWDKVQEATKEEGADADAAKKSLEEESKWSEDMSSKVGQAIDAMTAIKEELQKVSTEEKKEAEDIQQ